MSFQEVGLCSRLATLEAWLQLTPILFCPPLSSTTEAASESMEGPGLQGLLIQGGEGWDARAELIWARGWSSPASGAGP